MNRLLTAQGLGKFYLYKADTYKMEYVADEWQLFKGNFNLFFNENEKKTKKGPHGEYVVELEKTKELEDFLKNQEYIGAIFVNEANKNKKEIFQIFLMKLSSGTNPNKLYFSLEKYRNKIAIGASLDIFGEEKYIEHLKNDILYILDRL